MGRQDIQPTIPPEVKKELIEDARITSYLGDSVGGEPTVQTPGTRANRSVSKLKERGVNIQPGTRKITLKYNLQPDKK